MFNKKPEIYIKQNMIVIQNDGQIIQAKAYNLKYDSPNKYGAQIETDYPLAFQIGKRDLVLMEERD